MGINQDIKTLYDQKCIQFDELNDQFNELQQQSTLIMNDLQDEIKELKRKCQLYQRQIKELKQKKKYIASTIQRQLDQAQKQKNQFKLKFKDFQKKVIQLQIINEDLQNQLRATKCTLQEYQTSTQRTMQQLAILRVQLQQSTASNQQQIARLKQQLKQTQDQITVMHKKTKKGQSYLSYPQNTPRQNLIHKQMKSQLLSYTPSSVKQSQSSAIQNINQQQCNKKDVFKQTLRGIRDYMQSIDTRKDQLRKVLLSHRQYTFPINS